MYVHLGWRTSNRPTGWSFGYCGSCQQVGVARLEKVVAVLYLNGIIPLYKKDKGQVARCDFCGRLVEDVRDWEGVALADWSHHEGVAALTKKLEISDPVGVGSTFTDARLHSLLSAVQQTPCFTRLEMGPVGILGGCIVAVAIAAPLGLWLHKNHLAPGQIGELGFVMLLSLISLVPGAIVGALTETLLRDERGVAARIREVYNNYPFDLYRLEELSREYGKRVHKAVQSVIDEVPRRW